MSKTLPLYVTNALAADRKQQVYTLSALIVRIYSEQKAGRETDNLSEQVFKYSPHKSLKTWQNYISAARAVSTGKGSEKLASLYAASTEPAEAVAPLMQWLETELKKRGYQLSNEDVANWAAGRVSMAVAKKNKDEADKKAAAEQAKVNAKADQTPSTPTLTEEEQAAKAALAQREADKLPTSEANTDDTSATGYSAAIKAGPPDGMHLLSVIRMADGTLDMHLNPDVPLSREEVLTLALRFEVMLDAMPTTAEHPGEAVPA